MQNDPATIDILARQAAHEFVAAGRARDAEQRVAHRRAAMKLVDRIWEHRRDLRMHRAQAQHR